MNKHDLKAAEIVRGAMELKRPTAAPAAADRLGAIAAKAEEQRDVQAFSEGASVRTGRMHAALIRLFIGERLGVDMGAVDLPALEAEGRLKGLADDTGIVEYTFDGELLVIFAAPHVGLKADDLAVLLELQIPL